MVKRSVFLMAAKNQKSHCSYSKDGPIVYMQDSGGNLYSFEVDSSYHDGAISTVKRTQIFRFTAVRTDL